MAYPEPIPRLNSRETEEFREKVEHFKLTREQSKSYESLLRQIRESKK
jgi:hypothetical protein